MRNNLCLHISTKYERFGLYYILIGREVLILNFCKILGWNKFQLGFILTLHKTYKKPKHENLSKDRGLYILWK